MNLVAKPGSRAAQQAHHHWQRGLAQSKKADWNGALQAFDAAVKLAPKDTVYLLNAAKAAIELGKLDKSLEYSRRATALEPGSDLAHMLQVRALYRLQRHTEILRCLEALPEDKRHSREYWNAMGCAQQNMGQHQNAIQSFMNVLAQQMDDALSHYRMGISFYELALKEEASECFRTGLVLGLGHNALHVHGMLAYAERENCRWPQAVEEEAALRQLLETFPMDAPVMTAPFAHATLIDDPMNQLKACTLMSNTWREVKPLERARCVGSGDAGRIRVGYLSADFHQHATCVLMSEVFERQDRARFEVFLYSHGPDDKSAMRQRVTDAADHFVDAREWSDQEIAERIAADGIDVLIDLKGYTAANRFGVMARRPAPVQATFLGFPGTSGAKFIDYIIGDPVVTPLAHEAHFAEKIAQLPICYQPNDQQRPRPQAMTRAQVGLPEEALVLCAFNQAYKISAEVLDVWVGLLNDLPQSVLWLLDWHGQARPHLEAEIEARGIDLSRIHWAPRLGLAEHISRVQLADIFMDTWPCNAHTTASDALWAGLPVVTFMGETFASRVAGSLVRAVGLPELACPDLPSYVRTIKELAADAPRRAALKAHLVQARDHAALFDSAQYTRGFDALLERMVARQREGLSADHLLAAN